MLFLDLYLCFVKIGFLSFGGLSMVPLIREEMLAHGWLTSAQVSDIVAIAEMTPGSLGVNCATFAGIHAGGTLGSLVATLGVLTPSLTLCLLAALMLQRFKDSPVLGRLMGGIRPVCFGMILASMVTLALESYAPAWAFSWQSALIGALCALALIRLKLPIPAVIGLSAVLGIILMP